jgi:hypothetical protein
MFSVEQRRLRPDVLSAGLQLSDRPLLGRFLGLPVSVGPAGSATRPSLGAGHRSAKANQVEWDRIFAAQIPTF